MSLVGAGTRLALFEPAYCLMPAVGRERDDILIADFEGKTYQNWVATGTAFGSEPAHGPLPGQMAVSGFEGKGLVNSFSGGDASTGTLTSRPFKVERRYLNFLIGGGNHPGEGRASILPGGEAVIVRTRPSTTSQRASSSTDAQDVEFSTTSSRRRCPSRSSTSARRFRELSRIDQIVQSIAGLPVWPVPRMPTWTVATPSSVRTASCRAVAGHRPRGGAHSSRLAHDRVGTPDVLIIIPGQAADDRRVAVKVAKVSTGSTRPITLRTSRSCAAGRRRPQFHSTSALRWLRRAGQLVAGSTG